jgi:GLPGLI family protein
MRVLLAMAFCLLSIGGFAQNSEGTILYKETIKMDISFEGMEGLTDEMKAMIPKEQSFESTLSFNKNASLYTNVIDQASNDVDYKSEEEDVQIKIQMDSPERSYYKDLKTKEIVESQDLFGKTFLILGGEKTKWKITSETKEVLGYTCKKATTARDGKAIEAWFTTEIPSSIGPASFHYLPGAVLAVSSDGGKYIIEATKINLEAVDVKNITKPKKGKKVSHEEYGEIVKEKEKEMAEMYGGKGGVIIKMETDER